MPPNAASLIEECTNGTTKAALYLSRLGLEQAIKNPNKPGRPDFKSVPAICNFWVATVQKVNAIAALYTSRKAIREALRTRHICLDEIASCLETYGQQIWNNGVEPPFVLSVVATTTLSKIKGHAQVAEDKYLRHLIYEHPSDERKIRLQVSAWIIQRACRKAEDDRRGGKTPQRAYRKASTKSSSFVEAVRMDHSKRTRSASVSSDDSMDELCPDYPTDPSVRPKHTEHSDTVGRPRRRSSEKDHDMQHTPEKRRKNQTVAVVIPARKPWNIKATEMPSRKSGRMEPLGKRDAVLRSAREKIKEEPRETPQLPMTCGTTPRRMGVKPRGERPVQGVADADLELLVRQIDHYRDDLGVQLLDLLSPHNPGYYNLADIKRTTELIDTIALNDAEGLQKALGDAHDKHKIALDRWLGCVKTLVEFREITSLEGDEVVIEARFGSLTLDIKKGARLLRNRKRREILGWFTKDKFEIFDFSEEVVSMLLKMTSWGGLDMDPEELLDDMIPFTTRLLEWFRAVPSNSTTSVIKP